MVTLRQRCINESTDTIRGNFLDSFRREPSYDMIRDSILDLDHLSVRFRALLAATVDELCGEQGIKRPDWIFDQSTYLDDPYFALDAKGLLRIILLQESPRWYRGRNIFVSANCSERV